MNIPEVVIIDKRHHQNNCREDQQHSINPSCSGLDIEVARGKIEVSISHDREQPLFEQPAPFSRLLKKFTIFERLFKITLQHFSLKAGRGLKFLVLIINLPLPIPRGMDVTRRR